MSDKYDEQAAELVEHCRYCGKPDYRPHCGADHAASLRDVAAALRALGEKIERLELEIEEAGRHALKVFQETKRREQ